MFQMSELLAVSPKIDFVSKLLRWFHLSQKHEYKFTQQNFIFLFPINHVMTAQILLMTFGGGLTPSFGTSISIKNLIM